MSRKPHRPLRPGSATRARSAHPGKRRPKRARSTSSQTWRVAGSDDGWRLGNFLREHLQNVTMRGLKRALERGCCQVNGVVETFASRRVRHGDQVQFMGEPESPAPRRLTITRRAILFEDDHLLVYDKPAGFPCGPTAGRARANLFAALKRHLEQRGHSYLAMVHRLDRDTSGALLFAKQATALKPLEDLFRTRRVTKTYLAVVDGVPRPATGRITSRLKRVAGDERWERWASTSRGGKQAVTDYEIVRSFKRATLVRLLPQTGRTHQLRVHLSELGHPILGDAFYARQFRCPLRPAWHLLHAVSLCFSHPLTKQQLTVEAPLPAHFVSALEQLP